MGKAISRIFAFIFRLCKQENLINENKNTIIIQKSNSMLLKLTTIYSIKYIHLKDNHQRDQYIHQNKPIFT
jgi:hypothetical protein